MSLRPGPAARLSIMMHADARWHHHSVSDEIIQRALQAGLAGASRFHGIEGFGHSGVLHSDADPDVVRCLPCEVVIVDPSGERIRDFLPLLDEVLDHGVAVLDTVEIVTVNRSTPAPAGPLDA